MEPASGHDSGRASFLARPGQCSGLERKDRPSFGAVILPFVGWSASNRVYVGVVQSAGGIDRLLKAEGGPGIEFVIQGSDGTLAHQEWQWGGATAVVGANKARIVQVTIDHLILADGEVELPACVMTMRVGIEPPGKRQPELDESAKRADRPLRSYLNRPATASRGNAAGRWSGSSERAQATQYGATGSSQRAAIERGERSLYASQSAHIGGEGVELPTEDEA